ncbi:UDP-forming cellulose synthase catalytic subunit [Terracidiphilus sp.]|jgi:cellulose synthase (UDP-forming)|uniref:UDP-forming cellulose synthase catalytic subunit n=1 Tax=Terracidiphilus sp. TaxID=1964191 RepID=UPI003C2A1E3F
MSVTRFWQNIGRGDNFFTGALRLAFLAITALIFYFFAVLPLTWPQQVVCGLLFLLIGIAVARSSDSYIVTLTLMMMSIFCTFRYGYWRLSTMAEFFRDPSNKWGVIDVLFMFLLLSAEIYAFIVMGLGYFQTIWPLRRAPVALPDEENEWPHIDVLVPTYNEPLEVVRYTVLGALNLDWPADKLHVYLLDDGRRKEFEEFAREAGVGYKIRDNNKHAKAGNINTALKSLDSPYVAIFDCDHVPTRSFLQMTVGWFLSDPKLAMLQTPHHFYSPDPFERNLEQFRIIPNEGELFYGIVQDGNDFWNATFFCGSCAVLRRTALDEIGGIAVETVTEDAHTSLRMQMNGWNTAYINIPQAAGLATERLSAHVGQRIRWARGMIQILRTDNPLFARGLKFPQRLCYFNAMLHFLYAAPRLIFLTAPLAYLLLNRSNLPGYWAAILAYAVPHLVMANLTNSRIQGEHRHSFWNEIYETVLSPYILIPTILALFNPKLGKFNVTAKGGVVEETYFDKRIAWPFLVLLALNFLGLLVAIPRYFIWDAQHPGTVIMNSIWCVLNIVILGVTTAVARELKQHRSAVRIDLKVPVVVRMPDGRLIAGQTADMSSGGLSIHMQEPVSLDPETPIHVIFPVPSTANELSAAVIHADAATIRARFDAVTIPEQELLTTVLYTRADSWLGWGEARERDDIGRSFLRILHISMRGLVTAFRGLFAGTEKRAGRLPAVTSLLLFALAISTLAVSHRAAAQAEGQQAYLGSQERDQIRQQPVPAGQFRDTFSLNDTGTPPIELHGIDTNHTVYFTLPQTHVPRTAKIHVFYIFSPSLLSQLSHIRVSINGTMFAAIEPRQQGNGSASENVEQVFDIPTELLVHNNALNFQFIGHYAMTCEDPANTTLWAKIHRGTYLDIQGDMLPLNDDLKQLPMPFLDPAVVQPLSLPVVFPVSPLPKAIQAAGIATSYFGMISENRPVRFPVHIGAIPKGDVILIANDPGNMPAGLNLPEVHSPLVAMRTNPNDPYGKVLVIAGSDDDELIRAAQSIAMRSGVLNGPTVSIDDLILPGKQLADRAPRWAQTDQTVSLWDYSTAESMQGDGSAPRDVYFRLAPDIFYSERPNAILRLAYRYNSIPIGPISSLQIRINNAFLGSVPLVPGDQTARTTKIDVPVPVVNLRPFSNSLSFDFTFQLLKSNNCRDTTPISMQGAILRDSYLDMRGYPHYAPMPNLEIFANAGFPFTRFADLNNTTVVLPPQPTEQEIEMFVTLMGHWGRQTGYPGLRVTVAGPDSLASGAKSDFLVIGTGDDQPAFDKLSRYLPVSLANGKVQVHDTQGFLAPLHRAWWKQSAAQTESGELVASGSPDGILEGIESPFDSGSRSIVAIRIKDSSNFEPFMSTFLYVQQASDIQGSVSFLLGTRFQSFRVGSTAYYVGELPLWTRLEVWFSEVPWLAGIIVLVFAFLMAIWVRQWLRHRARRRLNMM